jgi:hypothetical protein
LTLEVVNDLHKCRLIGSNGDEFHAFKKLSVESISLSVFHPIYMQREREVAIILDNVGFEVKVRFLLLCCLLTHSLQRCGDCRTGSCFCSKLKLLCGVSWG